MGIVGLDQELQPRMADSVLFQEKLDVNEDCTFHRLISKQFPDIRSILKFFEDAFNHSDAVKNGKIIPGFSWKNPRQIPDLLRMRQPLALLRMDTIVMRKNPQTVTW